MPILQDGYQSDTLHCSMSVKKAKVEQRAFNQDIELPYNLRLSDFKSTMEDIYEFMFEMNEGTVNKGWGRLEDALQKQALSNVLSNLLNMSLAKHSKGLVVNGLPNGHPDLIIKDKYSDNKIPSAAEGLEVKATSKCEASVDMHSARDQHLCTFVYKVDSKEGKPISEREPLKFVGIFLGHVTEEDYRKNSRGKRGTQTATLDKNGLLKYRRSWVYMTDELRETHWCKRDLGLTLLG